MLIRSPIFLALLVAGSLLFHRAQASVVGVCDGRLLPSDEDRQAHNIHLECSSGSDSYVRLPQSWDWNAWKNAEMRGDRTLMQKIGRNLPEVKWSGTLPYSTVEKWDWVEWYYGQDPVCGYHDECHTEYTTVSDGKGGTTSQSQVVCISVMNSCYHDEPRSGSRFCSAETISYQAHYHLPDEKEWGPNSPAVNEKDPLKRYWDILPNKYDLMPGEMETIQVTSNSGSETNITPSASFGDPWNEYRTQLEFNGGGGTRDCLKGQVLNLDVTIHTLSRLLKTTPNNFRPAQNPITKEPTPYEWGETSTGIKDFPVKLLLDDASYSVISTIADQSRKFETPFIEDKIKSDTISNDVKAQSDSFQNDKAQKGSGFWMDTQMRLELKRDRPGYFDVLVGQTDVVMGSEVSFEEHYQVELDSTSLRRATGPIFKNWGKLNYHPNKKYYITVQMAQPGVPFYNQDASKGDVFSTPITLPFKIEKDAPDERSVLQKVSDWMGKTIWEKLGDLF